MKVFLVVFCGLIQSGLSQFGGLNLPKVAPPRIATPNIPGGLPTPGDILNGKNESGLKHENSFSFLFG
jgi:hypothetical protein